MLCLRSRCSCRSGWAQDSPVPAFTSPLPEWQDTYVPAPDHSRAHAHRLRAAPCLAPVRLCR
eukprot:4869047-Alexandrium_andersonii.AAC.1